MLLLIVFLLLLIMIAKVDWLCYSTDDAYAQLCDVYALLPCCLVCLIGFSLCFCNCPLTLCFHLFCSVMRERRFCPRLKSERDGTLHLSPLSPGLYVTCDKYYLILLKLELSMASGNQNGGIRCICLLVGWILGHSGQCGRPSVKFPDIRWHGNFGRWRIVN